MRKVMDEPINFKNKKQARQKPPLSVGRIVGEILAGTATGFAVAVPTAIGLEIPAAVLALYYVFGSNPPEDCFGVELLVVWVFAFLIIPPVYTLGSIGVGSLSGGDGISSGSIIAIPAPGAILLGSIGVGLVGWLRRRRKL